MTEIDNKQNDDVSKMFTFKTETAQVSNLFELHYQHLYNKAVKLSTISLEKRPFQIYYHSSMVSMSSNEL